MGTVALKDMHLDNIERFYADLLLAGVGVRTVRILHNILHKALDKGGSLSNGHRQPGFKRSRSEAALEMMKNLESKLDEILEEAKSMN